MKFDTSANTVTFYLGEESLRTVRTLDLIKSISINGKGLLNGYKEILIEHNGKKERQPNLIGADDLRRYALVFHKEYNTLTDFLLDCHLHEYESMANLCDELEKEGNDDATLKQVYNLSTLYSNLMSVPGGVS